MAEPRTSLLPFLLVIALAAGVLWFAVAPSRGVVHLGEVDGARHRLTAAEARAAQVRPLPAPSPLRFSPETTPADRQAMLAAIAQARPEARRLVGLVTGLTTVSVGVPPESAAVGVTSGTEDGFEVLVDLRTAERHGARGIARVMLHELAHVLDAALVPTALETQLDAATPAGYGCDDGYSGGCASRAERFAESFAKWATGDIGAGLYIGYRIPPPAPDWGAPLAQIG